MSRRDFSAQLAQADKQLAKSGAMMRRLIKAHGPCTLAPAWKRSPFEALVRAIIYQQLHGRAAATILQRLIDLFPEAGFPSAQNLLEAPDAKLRGVGLSRQKTGYLRDLAAKTEEGLVPLSRTALSRASDEEIIARFTQVKGIGRWTVEMLLIFTLGRLDVLPVDDYGVRKGYTRADGRQTPVATGELRLLGEAWAPWRSVAAWYFWRASEDTQLKDPSRPK